MIKRILITGASGFIGRHVCAEFASKGYEIIGMGHGAWPDWKNDGLVEWHQLDIELDALIKFAGKPELIIHCAGGSSVGLSISQPALDFDKSVKTTSNVLEYIRLYSPKTKLIFPSSTAVYGQVTRLPISEDEVISPISPYGFHKHMAESLCRLYSSQYGVSVSVVRLFSVYGIGLKKQLLWDACQKLMNGDDYFMGTGEEIRDWLNVKDVASLFYTLSQKYSDSIIINVGSGQGVKVKNILELIIEQLGLKLKPRFSNISRNGDPQAFIANISKAKLLNWSPTISWQQGVSEYVEWFKTCQK